MTSDAAPADAAPADTLLAERGRTRAIEAHVVACVFDRAGATVAFGTAEGGVHLLGRQGEPNWRDVAAHDGSLLCLAPLGEGFVSGGDDGALARIGIAGAATPFARLGGRWVENCVVSEDRRSAVVAVSVGKRVVLLDANGAEIRAFEHPSTVTGLAFDAKGKRIAASHYNGVSVSFVGSTTGMPRVFEWKGSHIGVALHPGAEAVVTAMQENALHGWRLSDGHNMRMSGYPSKTHALSFSRTGKWLATSGADTIVLWPFFGGGPMGKPPAELAGGAGTLCTRVAFNPRQDNVAAGFADGTVLLADVASERILTLCGPGRGAVSALAWNEEGGALAFGTETGTMALLDLTSR